MRGERCGCGVPPKAVAPGQSHGSQQWPYSLDERAGWCLRWRMARPQEIRRSCPGGPGAATAGYAALVSPLLGTLPWCCPLAPPAAVRRLSGASSSLPPLPCKSDRRRHRWLPSDRCIEQSEAVARAPVLIAVVVPPWVPRRCPPDRPRRRSRIAAACRLIGAPRCCLSSVAVRPDDREVGLGAANFRKLLLGVSVLPLVVLVVGGVSLAPGYSAAAPSSLPLSLPTDCPAAGTSSALRWCRWSCHFPPVVATSSTMPQSPPSLPVEPVVCSSSLLLSLPTDCPAAGRSSPCRWCGRRIAVVGGPPAPHRRCAPPGRCRSKAGQWSRSSPRRCVHCRSRLRSVPPVRRCPGCCPLSVRCCSSTRRGALLLDGPWSRGGGPTPAIEAFKRSRLSVQLQCPGNYCTEDRRSVQHKLYKSSGVPLAACALAIQKKTERRLARSQGLSVSTFGSIWALSLRATARSFAGLVSAARLWPVLPDGWPPGSLRCDQSLSEAEDQSAR